MHFFPISEEVINFPEIHSFFFKPHSLKILPPNEAFLFHNIWWLCPQWWFLHTSCRAAGHNAWVESNYNSMRDYVDNLQSLLFFSTRNSMENKRGQQHESFAICSTRPTICGSKECSTKKQSIFFFVAGWGGTTKNSYVAHKTGETTFGVISLQRNHGNQQSVFVRFSFKILLFLFMVNTCSNESEQFAQNLIQRFWKKWLTHLENNNAKRSIVELVFY